VNVATMKLIAVLILVSVGWSTDVGSLKYMMFYDFDPPTQANFSNMGFSRLPWQITQGAAYGFESLFIVDQWFFYQPGSHLRLLPNYLQSWQNLWTTTIQPLIVSTNSSLKGVFIGDELLFQGLSVDELTAAAVAVRASWPSAIIYWNEEWETITTDFNRFDEPVGLDSIPDVYDWVSLDYYK